MKILALFVGRHIQIVILYSEPPQMPESKQLWDIHSKIRKIWTLVLKTEDAIMLINRHILPLASVTAQLVNVLY